MYSNSMPKRKKKKKFVPCQFCLSPYRYQIEQAFKSGVKRPEIADHYHSELKYATKGSFVRALQRHFEADHFKKAKKVAPAVAPKGSEHKMPNATLKGLSQSLLNIGQDMVEYYKDNPLVARKELNFREIIKAQDALTNRMKVEVQQDALKLAMAKFFGGFIPQNKGEVIDGEESEISLLPENKE